MSKNILFKKPRKLKKYAETITIQGEDIKTRMSKSAVTKRIKDWGTYDYDSLSGGFDYFDFVNWGAEGGRPKKWESVAVRQKIYRLRLKMRAGKPLKEKEVKWMEQLSKQI